MTAATSLSDSHDSLNILEDVIAQAKRAGADAADAVFITSTDISANHRMGKAEDVERAESIGLGLRVFVGSKLATISTETLTADALNEATQRAVAMAKVSTDDPHSTLAPEELLVQEVKDCDLYDTEEPSINTLQEACARAEAAALEVKGITNSEGADAAHSRHSIAIATSHGLAQEYRVTDSSLSVCVLAGEGTGMERDYDYSSKRFYADLDAPDLIGKNAAERTLRRLNPSKVETQQVPIIFDPRVSKGLVGKLAGAANGASIARGTSFLKDAMGEQLFHESINIIDNPHLPRGMASKPFDGEGVQNDELALVKKGKLNSWLLDTRSANQLGLTTNGRAARGLSGSPSPSSTNLYMEAGSISVEDMLADIESGFYVTDLFGGGVSLLTGDYSQGASGLWIDKGELTYAVSEVTIAGHLKEMFKQLTPADDLEMRYGTNAPTIRVDGMMLAGG